MQKKTFLGFEPRIPPLFSLSTVSSTTPQQAAAACVIRPPFFREPPLTSPLPNSTLTTGQRTGQFPPFIPLCREHLPDRFVLDDTGFHLHRRRGDLRNRPARNRALAPCKWPTFVALFSPLFDLFSSLPPLFFLCSLPQHDTTRHGYTTTVRGLFRGPNKSGWLVSSGSGWSGLVWPRETKEIPPNSLLLLLPSFWCCCCVRFA